MKKLALILLGIAATTQSHATLLLDIGGADFKTSDGSLTPAGTLFQLINLGPDGVFNRINVDDGTVNGLERWVSGDDSVINVNVIGADFATTTAFDLSNGADTPGFLQRGFELADNAIPVGTKVGIRWFPGLQASNFASITLSGAAFYGQFTRQTNPAFADAWVITSASGNTTFDPMLTSSFGGTDSDAAGGVARAFNQVDPVPEPGSIVLALMGAAGLAVLRRRRA